MYGMDTVIAYGCGSPIRLPLVEALAQGARAKDFIADANPTYRGGNSIIWGLIRGANSLMSDTRKSSFNFYQMDNAYFGRERYFRVTKNALQLSKIGKINEGRFLNQFKESNLSFEPWKRERPGPIVLCTSSEFLYGFYGTTMQNWVEQTVIELRRHTDRPIVLRKKQLGGIEDAIKDSWCVVTHSSAAALDALRIGIPVIVTAECAASPLATKIEQIENPKINVGRGPLFSTLAYGQFTIEEMCSGYAWEIVK